MKIKIFDIIAATRTGDKTVEDATQELLNLFSVSNSFIFVSEKEPPKHKELIVQSTEGQNYVSFWRADYSIFTCQNKGEDSFNWKWKEI